MAKVEVVGLADVDALAITHYQPFRVTVEDWREVANNGGRRGSTWTFTVQASDVSGAVSAAKRVMARRTTDRIVSVVADNGGR